MAGPYALQEVLYATLLQKIKNPKTYSENAFSSCFDMNALYSTSTRRGEVGLEMRIRMIFRV